MENEVLETLVSCQERLKKITDVMESNDDVDFTGLAARANEVQDKVDELDDEFQEAVSS